MREPEHGEPARYLRGCKCRTCLDGWNERQKQYMIDHPEQREKRAEYMRRYRSEKKRKR